MRPRQRDIECSISSLTRNQSTGVPRSPSPWFGFESLSAHSLQRGERGLGAGAVQKRRAGGAPPGTGADGGCGRAVVAGRSLDENPDRLHRPLPAPWG